MDSIVPNFTVMSPSVFREILEQLVPQNNIFVVEFSLEKIRRYDGG